MLSSLPRCASCLPLRPLTRSIRVQNVRPNWEPARGKHILAATVLAAAALPWSDRRLARAQRGSGLRCFASTGRCALKTEFCGKPSRGFTPIFYADTTANTASVNAGDYNLYVGGGSINLAFAKELGLPSSNDYQEMHKALLAAAAKCPGKLVKGSDAPAADKLRSNLGLLGCFGRLPANVKPGTSDPVGAAFLDVFGTVRPLSQQNVAMLYVVGPKGTGSSGGHGPTVDSKSEFLRRVQDMAENAFSLVAEYNLQAKEHKLPEVEIVQFCLVSGGVYMHPDSTKKDVAVAIVQGLKQAAASVETAAAAQPIVRFAYDANCFEDAVAQLA